MGYLFSNRKHNWSTTFCHHFEQPKLALGVSNVLHYAGLFLRFRTHIFLLPSKPLGIQGNQHLQVPTGSHDSQNHNHRDRARWNRY